MESSSEKEEKKQNTTEFISEKTVKNFLKKNNISLEKVGGEKEQEEYIAKLSKALIDYKIVVKGFKISQSIEDVIENVEKIFKEAGISEADSNKIIKNFIPEKTLVPDDAKRIEELKAKIEQSGQIIKQLSIDLENYEKKLAELETELKEIERMQEEGKADSSEGKEEPPAIETEGEEIENRDETPVEIYADMIRILREQNEKNKVLKEQGQKNYKTIGEGVVDVCKWSRDVLREYILIGKLDRDIILGGAFVATTGLVLIPGYFAGRVAGKVIKGVAKLGAKAVSGVGKTMFKATKGTAKKCKARVDKNRETKRDARVEETKKSLDEAKGITTMILDYSQTRKRVVTKENDMAFDRLPKPKQIELKSIEDRDTRPDIEEKLQKENENLLLSANRKLRSLRLKRISKKFYDKFGLDEISMGELLHNFEIDKNGELVEMDESLVSLDEISDAGLYDELKEAIEIPKVNEFSSDDIRDIINLLKAKNMMQDLDELVEREEISPEVAEYVAEVRTSLNNGFISNDDIAPVYGLVKLMELNDDILREAYLRDLVDIAQELHSQIITMEQEFEQIQDGNTRTDLKRREILRRIAEVKVDSLIEYGIVEIVRDENGREQFVINQGRDVLDLTEDLEYTTDLNRDKIERQSQQSKQNTEHSDDAEQGNDAEQGDEK